MKEFTSASLSCLYNDVTIFIAPVFVLYLSEFLFDSMIIIRGVK